MSKNAWSLIAILLLALAVACGPAVPPDETEATDETTETTETTSETAVATTDTTATDAVTVEDVPLAQPEILPVEVTEADLTTTDSGLQYYDIVAGDGNSPENGDIVSVAYTMWLEDGLTLLDSTQGQATEFILGSEQVFDGWNEGVLTMNEGGTRQLIIPPELGLGEEGFGDFIPPNSTLILEVELVSFRQSPTPTEVDADAFETTDSGLQIYDIEVGDGETPVEGDTVTLEFAIWLQDGMSYVAGSEDQGGEFSFALGSGQAFPGWEEGMLSMATGGTRQLIIPPELGLGEEGVPGLVPANATLVMEVTLLSIRKPAVMTEVDEADYITTESGLKYYDIEVGDGATPEAGQTVSVHYTGWLEDGTQFDSSLDRGQPFQFPLGQGAVIAGWDEGVATMQVGGKRQLVIPSDLAYGDSAAGIIPPGATLIFDVELLSVE
jgi:peptidylprolyl isomerase